jgi:hypothetical protein
MYLHRDPRDFAQVGNPAAFARWVRLAWLRTGGPLHHADLARDAAISRPTAHRWMARLETTYLATLLPPFWVTRAKRLIKIKTPKLYPLDCGLALHVCGLEGRAAMLAECGSLARVPRSQRSPRVARDSNPHAGDPLPPDGGRRGSRLRRRGSAPPAPHRGQGDDHRASEGRQGARCILLGVRRAQPLRPPALRRRFRPRVDAHDARGATRGSPARGGRGRRSSGNRGRGGGR